MAQQPHKAQQGKGKSTKPSEDRQGADKDRHPTPDDDNIHEEGEYKDQHVPLRDPSQGRSPAVIGRNASESGDFQAQADAQQAPVIGVNGDPIEDGERDPDTVSEEQRERAADMEEQGIHAWMAARDSRTEEQMADSAFVAEPEKQSRGGRANVIASGGGQFDDDRRQIPYQQDDEYAA